MLNIYFHCGLKYYLFDRTHKIKVNGAISTAVESKYGVPQGNVLGPLLLLLYINELSDVFANLFNREDVVTKLNRELKVLYG